ncbi:MAG: hypothetical protein GX417_05410 [Clostridiales bacterium]|nr:hypothetical protein [Clostridiales bacterium]
MTKFLTREKMGKRKRRALDRTKHGSWEGVIPVTRTIENKKRYNRKKSPHRYDDDGAGIFIQSAYHCRSRSSCGSL